MKSKVVWLIVTGLMVTALVLASCGPAATTTPPTTVPPTTAPPTTAPPTTKPPTTEPQYGGTLSGLHLHGNLEPQTWDPADCNWIVEPFTSPYMEHLLVGDLSKGPRGTNQFAFVDSEFVPPEFLKGNLAESWKMTDPTTIVFNLRKGIMWQDRPGVMAAREFVADDVVFSFNRLVASPKSAPSHYFLAGATAQDKYTVVVKLKQYNANWLTMIGYGYYCGIYPPELVKAGINVWQNATGTGPFKLTNYVSGASLTYEKNPNYWGTTTIGGKEYKLPFVDKLSWPIIVDESTQLAALRTGKIDMATSFRWIYKDTLAQSNPELMVWKWRASGFHAIALRCDTKPFDDVKVRRALSMAVDRENFIKTQLGGEGISVSGPFWPDWPETLYTPLEKLPAATKALFEYSPTKAKQLLTEAGYPNGFKTEMTTMTFPYVVDYCSFVAANWKDIGVEVALQPLEYATYLSLQYGMKHKPMFYYSKGDGQPTRLLQLIGTPGQYWNPAMFNDSYYNDTCTKIVGMSDEKEQYRLSKDLNVYLLDQCPYVILPTGYYYGYNYPWVKNWYGENNTGCRHYGASIFASMWLDRDLKEEMTGRR